MQGLKFVTLKAFGDYVIAYASLRGRVDGHHHLIGAHLAELAHAIDPDWPASLVGHAEHGVPAVYDIRKRGARAALKSALDLRRGLAVPARNAAALVFDRVTMRERLLAAPARLMALPSADNIYQAYAAFLDANGARAGVPAKATRNRAGQGVGIFAGSRIVAKRIPVPLCKDLLSLWSAPDRHARIIVLAGEYPEIEQSSLPVEIVPRSFASMIEAVARCAIVISADSLPAHLADLAGQSPVVLTPRENSYWLPPSTFASRAWALFDDGVDGAVRALDRA